MLEDDVGRVAKDLLDPLREAAGPLKRAFSSSGDSPPFRIIAGELVAVDVVDRAELLHQLALLRRGDDADRVGAGRLAQLRREDAEPAGSPPVSTVARLDLAAVMSIR